MVAPSVNPARRSKQRLPLVVVVVAIPVAIAGSYLWLTGAASDTTTARLLPAVATRPQPTPRLADDWSLDLNEQTVHIRAEVARRQAAAVTDSDGLGLALLQLGKLESALGNLEAATAAFRAVPPLHDVEDH